MSDPVHEYKHWCGNCQIRVYIQRHYGNRLSWQLGMEEDDKLGLLMGWAGKDDFIDFGIEDAENGEYRLDFNCRVLHWFDPCFPYILPPVSVDYE